MEREQMIELAKQAGCQFPLRSGFGDCQVPQFFGVDGLERFAAAVEAATIERCAEHPPVAKPGWKLVPIEPTEEMIMAYQYSWGPTVNYKAMLEAAPGAE